MVRSFRRAYGRQFSYEQFRLDVNMYTCVLPIFLLRRASFPDLHINFKLCFIFIHLFAQCRLPAITDPPRRSRIKGHNYRSSNSLELPACVKKKNVRFENQSREQLELVAARDCRHPIHAGFQEQVHHHWGRQEISSLSFAHPRSDLSVES